MIGNIVARRYARALFAIGKEKGVKDLDSYGKDLNGLMDMVSQSPELIRIFRNPIFTIEEKKAVVAKLLEKGGTGQIVSNFCYLLADKERLAVLPDIVEYFNTLLDVEQGIVRGELVSAVKLKKAKQKTVLKELEEKSGQKLVLDFSTDAAILGGVVLKIGDRVLDASLRAQLGILKDNIKRGE